MRGEKQSVARENKLVIAGRRKQTERKAAIKDKAIEWQQEKTHIVRPEYKEKGKKG